MNEPYIPLLTFPFPLRLLLAAEPKALTEVLAVVRRAISSLTHLQAASVACRITIGPHAGRKAFTLYSVAPMEETSNHPLLANRFGFSLDTDRQPR